MNEHWESIRHKLKTGEMEDNAEAMRRPVRTDMATEFTVDHQMSGLQISQRRIPYPVTEVCIQTKEAADAIGKPCGRYFTVEELDFKEPCDDLFQTVCSLKSLLLRLMPKTVNHALVVGLGNRSITADSLGPMAVQYTLVTRHLQGQECFEGLENFNSIAAFSPGVLGQTGIETADFVKAVCDAVKPDLVIAVDALAAAEHHRLCNSLQFSDTGIVPGSGVKNHRRSLSRETLGVPVIAIGVPTVVEWTGQNGERAGYRQQGLFVTPREVDACMEHAGKLIGMVINAALHPRVSLEDLMQLVG